MHLEKFSFITLLMTSAIFVTGCSGDNAIDHSKSNESVGIQVAYDREVSNDFVNRLNEVLKLELAEAGDQIHAVVQNVVNDESYIKNEDNKAKFTKLADERINRLTDLDLSPKTNAEREIQAALRNYLGYKKGTYRSLKLYSVDQDAFYKTTYEDNHNQSLRHLESLKNVLDKYGVAIDI